jgi:hypothetical protein
VAHHVGECEARKVFAHVISDVRPHVEQDALALVIARPVLVGLSEVTGHDWTVHRGHDFGQGDCVGATGQNVAAAYSTLRSDQTHTLQAQQYLLKIWLGKSGPFRQIAY